MSKRFWSILLAAVLLCCPVGLLGSGTQASAKELWESKVIAYDDIEDIVDGSLDFSGQSSAINQSIAALKQSQQSLNKLSQQLSSAAAQLPQGSTLADMLNGLQTMTQSLSAQLTSTSNSLSQSMVQIDQARNQVVIGAKNLYIAYNSLVDQQDELRRSLDVFDKNLAASQKQYELGMITALDLENTKSARNTISSGIDTMDLEITALKRSFNTLIGRNYNQGLTIKSLPQPDTYYVEKIHFSDDLQDAYNNYISWGGSSSVPSNQEKFDEEKGSFGASFRKLYENIGDKQRLLTNAQATLALEQKNYDASLKKYQLGMLSELALVSAQDQLDTQKAAVRTAETNLFSAIEQYKWALEYGIISE